MPALDNPRWERFAFLLFVGLSEDRTRPHSQGKAYQLAGYLAKDAGKSGGSAEACASRLLKKAKPILDRVKELQAEANARLEPELDVSRHRVGKRLDKASQIAEQSNNAAAMATCELGIAKVFGHITDKTELTSVDFTQVKSMHDMGCKLLQSVGFAAPDDASVREAIEANDAFVLALEHIRDKAKSTVDVS
jgi:hypothetical protein